MSYQTLPHVNSKGTAPCGHFPELVRMNYFYGQMLGPRDFLTEQTYHRAKHLLINRCLHGYGVICGLLVEAVPSDEQCRDPEAEKANALYDKIAACEAEIANVEARDPKDPKLKKLEADLETLHRERDEFEHKQEGSAGQHKPAKHMLKLGCGFAIDPAGHEIIAGHDVMVDIDAHLSDADREKLKKERRGVLYISICYAECGFEPVRPAALDQCELTPGCRDARVLEAFRISISLEAPEADERCETCCTGSCDTCVLLAKVRYDYGCAIRPQDVDNSVRRPFGLYAPTVITGINWRQGGIYSPEDAQALLGTGSNAGGIEIRFSRKIHVSSIKPGVVDLLSFTGGRGVAGEITHISGKFIDLPANGMVDRIIYRDTTDERPRPGDRILVIVRCDFLLDACCRAVDGNHIGGRVPYIGAPAKTHYGKKPEEPTLQPCIGAPGHGGAWTSGNGTPGGSFESWFYIARDKETVE